LLTDIHRKPNQVECIRPERVRILGSEFLVVHVTNKKSHIANNIGLNIPLTSLSLVTYSFSTGLVI